MFFIVKLCIFFDKCYFYAQLVHLITICDSYLKCKLELLVLTDIGTISEILCSLQNFFKNPLNIYALANCLNEIAIR